jgi:hypothetical protein
VCPIPADPTVLHPIPDQTRVVLLKPLVTSPLIDVGEYSYYDDPVDAIAFETTTCSTTMDRRSWSSAGSARSARACDSL